MNVLSFVTGLVLLAAVSLDFLFTTIGAQEKTIASFRISRSLFKALRGTTLARRHVWPHWFSGPLVMTGLAGWWVLGVSLGWTMIFAAFPESIAPGRGQSPPGWWDVYAHVGHLLSTLGAGTTLAATTVWYVVGVFVAVNGMVILTLAVSFTLSTTQTVARGRAFAALAEVLDPAAPENFTTFAPLLSELCSSLKSAPFALFYSAGDERLRLPSALARFAERASAGEAFARYRRILGMLPGLHVDRAAPSEEFVATMRSWREDYALSP